jgi:hypothetical protein
MVLLSLPQASFLGRLRMYAWRRAYRTRISLKRRTSGKRTTISLLCLLGLAAAIGFVCARWIYNAGEDAQAMFGGISIGALLIGWLEIPPAPKDAKQKRPAK